MRSRLALPVLLAALVVASAGCSDGSPSPSRQSTSRSASAQPSASTTGSATPSPSGTTASSPGASGTAAPSGATPPSTGGSITTPSGQESFGSTVNYSDAVSVSIDTPRIFPPSSFAWAGDDHAAYVRMTITVVNGSGQPLPLDGFHVAVTSGGAAGQRVISADDGLGDPAAAGQLAPGQETEFDVAFGINDPTDLTVEAAPSSAAPKVTWTTN